ncbi:hypothetical protein U1Q18_051441 [Sarracenia purpurea var. burkii]
MSDSQVDVFQLAFPDTDVTKAVTISCFLRRECETQVKSTPSHRSVCRLQDSIPDESLPLRVACGFIWLDKRVRRMVARSTRNGRTWFGTMLRGHCRHREMKLSKSMRAYMPCNSHHSPEVKAIFRTTLASSPLGDVQRQGTVAAKIAH